MKIKKIITINWANLENREYMLDDLVFLTGQTGVGKSTFLDAIQTALTAAYNNIVNYNAGQDESDKKSKHKEYRKLEGYILGEDRELYSRPQGAIGTIVVTFVSSKNENNKIFNAIVNTKCSLEEQGKKRKAVIDELNFFIVKEYEIVKDDLLNDKEILLGNNLYNSLERNQKIEKENILYTHKKEDYLTLLYGNLWGTNRTSIEKAKKAAKALANFIYARPVNDLDSFIRDEFLEEKKMEEEVTRLSEALITLQDLKEESRIVEEATKELSFFSNTIQNILQNWEKNQLEHYLYQAYQYKSKQEEYEALIEKFAEDDKQISILNKELEKNTKQKDDIKRQLKPLYAKRDNSETFKRIGEVQDEVKSQIENISEIKIGLNNYASYILNSFWKNINTLIHEQFDIGENEDLTLLFNKLEEFSNLNIQEILSYNTSVKDSINEEGFKNKFLEPIELLIKIETLFKKIKQAKKYIDKVNESSNILRDLRDRETTLVHNETQLHIDISNLQNKKIVCPRYIMEQFTILQSLLPEIQISMLYQHVDFKENEREWAHSIEGFLKNNRFAIVVPVGYELEAVHIVKSEKLNNLKIIQSEKMLNDFQILGSSVKQNSIINKLVVTNDIVQAYLTKNYRNVLCYETEQELKNSERGVTKDNKAASGGLMFYCRANTLFFGESALKAMLLSFEKELENLQFELNGIRNKIPTIRQINNILIKDFANFNNDSRNLLNDFDKNFTGYTNNQMILASLDTSDFQTLEDSIEELELQVNSYDDAIIDAHADIKNLEKSKKNRQTEEDNVQKELNKANKNYEENKTYLMEIKSLTGNTSGIDYIELSCSEIEKPHSLQDTLYEEWNKLIVSYSKSKLFEQKEVFYSENEQILQHDYTISGFSILYNEKNKILAEFDRLNNSLQMKFKTEIEEGEREVKKVFVEGFCVTMYRNIKTSKQEIEQFSSMLAKHSFENDQFVLITKEADPEYEEYKKLFSVIAENKNLIAEANSDELELTKQRLLDKFLNISQNKNELLRISDYRNYSKYDILQRDGIREVSLSKSAKNSGGQGETSYYIIRSINLHSSLNPMISKNSTLETVLIDESFVKTNDDRAKEIINYLNKTLGFQIIMALPTKGANELLKMNCSNYNITKLPPKNRLNGELDYEIWSRYTNNNAQAINRFIKAEYPSLFEQATLEGQREYEQFS